MKIIQNFEYILTLYSNLAECKIHVEGGCTIEWETLGG